MNLLWKFLWFLVDTQKSFWVCSLKTLNIFLSIIGAFLLCCMMDVLKNVPAVHLCDNFYGIHFFRGVQINFYVACSTYCLRFIFYGISSFLFAHVNFIFSLCCHIMKPPFLTIVSRINFANFSICAMKKGDLEAWRKGERELINKSLSIMFLTWHLSYCIDVRASTFICICSI